MNTIITEPILQPVQQAIPQQVKTFTRDQMGYTDRPIDARTQTRNRYLDNVACRVTLDETEIRLD
jgi:hypothetical protein